MSNGIFEGETFLYNKLHKSKTDLNIWTAFPAIYNFGMAALGYLAIFKWLDTQENYYVERIFTDTQKTELRIEDVDLLSFSMSFELDFLNVFKILEKYNIPFKSKDRTDDMPIIFAGGPVMTSNPEPYCEFFDFIMVGDGENIVGLTECIRKNKNLSKKEILEKLSEYDSVYVPSLTEYDPKTRKVTKNGQDFSVKKACVALSQCIATPILTENSYFSNTYVMEIVRGCPQRCGFCLASYLNLPVRSVSYEEIIENIDFGLKYTNKIAFLGALIAAHPRFNDICKYVTDKINGGENIELSISSLRVDSISPEVIKMLVAAGQKHATIAIEAGSDRLRKVINKNLKEEQILNAAKIARENGLKGFKIYAMIGLPTETDEDIQEMVALAKKLKEQNKGFEFTFSFATFVPKAHTPFEFCAREDGKSLEKKYAYLQKQLNKIGVKPRISSVKWDYVQALLSRGDRRLNDYLIEVYNDKGNIGSFKKVYKEMRQQGLLPEADEFALNEIPFESNNPWDFIKPQTKKEELIKENKRLLEKNGR